jgi:NCAIR mutase (PurE)-related protein
MSNNDVTQILDQLLAGTLSKDQAAEKISSSSPILNVDNFAKIDTFRNQRTGFPEVVFGPGKTAEEVASIMSSISKNKRSKDDRYQAIITSKLEEEKYAKVADILRIEDPDMLLHYNENAQILYTEVNTQGIRPQIQGKVGVVCAGTSDRRIAEEAAVILELCGVSEVTRVYDVGVAGLDRLLLNLPTIRACDAIIVCAGMDGALPSVVGGLVRAPVVAVPTSVGYGLAMGGVSAMLTMLNTCAPGVSVVNVDNGFGASVCAIKMLKIGKQDHSD